ncbi:hypothetical protein [uncultured Microbacterium sp.]|uniref:hypothetical protein n=1 Tax=uncultured Microbacterium sp. TaxID=191216 RepID=UPI0035CC6DC1
MSSPYRPIPPLPVRERAACMCIHGGSCSTFAPGHALHLIQLRLVAATPSEWVDAIVTTVDAEGNLSLQSVSDGSPIVVWSGAGASDAVEVGTPVAVHERYHVLAVGDRRFNVLLG